MYTNNTNNQCTAQLPKLTQRQMEKMPAPGFARFTSTLSDIGGKKQTKPDALAKNMSIKAPRMASGTSDAYIAPRRELAKPTTRLHLQESCLLPPKHPQISAQTARTLSNISNGSQMHSRTHHTGLAGKCAACTMATASPKTSTRTCDSRRTSLQQTRALSCANKVPQTRLSNTICTASSRVLATSGTSTHPCAFTVLPPKRPSSQMHNQPCTKGDTLQVEASGYSTADSNSMLKSNLAIERDVNDSLVAEIKEMATMGEALEKELVQAYEAAARAEEQAMSHLAVERDVNDNLLAEIKEMATMSEALQRELVQAREAAARSEERATCQQGILDEMRMENRMLKEQVASGQCIIEEQHADIQELKRQVVCNQHVLDEQLEENWALQNKIAGLQCETQWQNVSNFTGISSLPSPVNENSEVPDEDTHLAGDDDACASSSQEPVIDGHLGYFSGCMTPAIGTDYGTCDRAGVLDCDDEEIECGSNIAEQCLGLHSGSDGSMFKESQPVIIANDGDELLAQFVAVPAVDDDLPAHSNNFSAGDDDLFVHPDIIADGYDEISVQPGAIAAGDDDLFAQPDIIVDGDDEFSVQPSSVAAGDDELSVHLNNLASGDKDLFAQPNIILDGNDVLPVHPDVIVDGDDEISVRPGIIAAGDDEISVQSDIIADGDDKISVQPDNVAVGGDDISVQSDVIADRDKKLPAHPIVLHTDWRICRRRSSLIFAPYTCSTGGARLDATLAQGSFSRLGEKPYTLDPRDPLNSDNDYKEVVDFVRRKHVLDFVRPLLVSNDDYQEASDKVRDSLEVIDEKNNEMAHAFQRGRERRYDIRHCKLYDAVAVAAGKRAQLEAQYRASFVV
ncbi:hypothetical protein COEREDRAFT_14272 [Coemansia reversa NRRL 1564]|uniref:Uncharacterized protein n=1 Tax=Coemansia reversa (strain ATCC 12441 / NRRL 1564) TaxID=763665 RepID=A0A2G5BFP7_COERN|nr:hypothetical protein COEREDRAFT_14272 [Coemansia reversa NRRL 1564]|eukprot:PIA17823.1 hypothetical protein COEREDRAFT_14272 [Coemansia reversa NRRL 1564]